MYIYFQDDDIHMNMRKQMLPAPLTDMCTICARSNCAPRNCLFSIDGFDLEIVDCGPTVGWMNGERIGKFYAI